FDTFRIEPILGRRLTPADDRPGAERVALLSEACWRRRFARDPEVLGRRLTLDDESFTVIGVLPGTMHGTWRQIDVFTSLGRLADEIGGESHRGHHVGVYVVARMKPDVSVDMARAEVVALA